MAAGPQFFTASQVGDLVTADTEDDREFVFPGSDDDFDSCEQQDDYEYDPLEKEQGKHVHQT